MMSVSANQIGNSNTRELAVAIPLARELLEP